ncbi:hypothetical protein RND81_05G092800 [Saponaria officinalis]|uniref:Exo_endo_phos domain-containing protein n=1 Tax=Saponaria officinalis TaxID=3572 RepID=A0AAW1KW02_SAPOF
MNEGIKQHEVVSFFKQNKLDIMGINESRIRQGNFRAVSRKRLSAFQILHNYLDHPNGRIWAIWRRGDMQVQLLSSASQWLHLKPWVVLGNFNCVRFPSERISGAPPHVGAMTDFNDALYDAGLEELTTSGCKYTWTNKQDGSARKWMRLDRAFVNPVWLGAFSSSSAEAHPACISDHSPVVVSFHTGFCPRPKQFKFLNCWAQDALFLDLVSDVWRMRMFGCPMYQLISRLKFLKPKLTALHAECYSNISDRVLRLRTQLLECQSRVQLDPLNQSLFYEEAALTQQFCKFKKVELNIAYQRAKVQDIRMMDARTSYFYAKVAARWNACNITSVMSTNGVPCKTFDDISDAFLGYY